MTSGAVSDCGVCHPSEEEATAARQEIMKEDNENKMKKKIDEKKNTAARQTLILNLSILIDIGNFEGSSHKKIIFVRAVPLEVPGGKTSRPKFPSLNELYHTPLLPEI